MKNLTPRQKEVVAAFKDRNNWSAPTFRDIGKILGMSAPSVMMHVRAIEKKGITIFRRHK